jgi:hypothetical protein
LRIRAYPAGNGTQVRGAGVAAAIPGNNAHAKSASAARWNTTLYYYATLERRFMGAAAAGPMV